MLFRVLFLHTVSQSRGVGGNRFTLRRFLAWYSDWPSVRQPLVGSNREKRGRMRLAPPVVGSAQISLTGCPLMEPDETRAEGQLWAAGYMVQPGMGGDKELVNSRGGKVAFATRNLSDGRWKVRKMRGCLFFGGSPAIDSDTPCVGFLKVLGMRLARKAPRRHRGQRSTRRMKGARPRVPRWLRLSTNSETSSGSS